MLTIHVVNQSFNLFSSFEQDKNAINILFAKHKFKFLGQSFNHFAL